MKVLTWEKAWIFSHIQNNRFCDKGSIVVFLPSIKQIIALAGYLNTTDLAGLPIKVHTVFAEMDFENLPAEATNQYDIVTKWIPTRRERISETNNFLCCFSRYWQRVLARVHCRCTTSPLWSTPASRKRLVTSLALNATHLQKLLKQPIPFFN